MTPNQSPQAETSGDNPTSLVVDEQIEIGLHKDGSFDEMFFKDESGQCVFHIEHMNDNTFWFRVYGKKHDVACFIGGTPISVSYEVEESDSPPAPPAAGELPTLADRIVTATDVFSNDRKASVAEVLRLLDNWRQLTPASTACDPELRKAFNTALQATKWKMLAALTQEECDLWTKAWEMVNSKPLTPASDEREVEIERLKARLAEVEGERDRAKAQRDTILAAANKFYKRATTAEARVRELEAENSALTKQWNDLDVRNEQRHREWSAELASALEREKGLREALEKGGQS